MLGDHEVTILGETGDRVMLVRDTVVERNIINSTIGTWPEDQPSQRCWALSVVTHNRPNPFKDSIDFSLLFKEAERIIDWVNGGRGER